MAPAGAPARVGILGRFGSGNVGNESSLEVVLDRLADRPDVSLDARCSGPEAMRRDRGIPAESLHWLDRPRTVRGLPRRLASPVLIATGAVIDAVRTAAWVGRHDLVVVPGTGPFESTTRVRPWQTPWIMCWASLSGRVLRTPVWYVCVGASRPGDPVTRVLLRLAAGLADHRSFRDEASRDAVAGLGVDAAADPVLPDLVWALPTPADHRRPEGDRPRVVGLGVMAYSPPVGGRQVAGGERALVTAWVELARHLAGAGHRVRVFYGDPEDRAVAEQVVAEASSAAVTCAEVTTTAELMAELVSMDTVIATRFHNVLCALLCERPTVSVGYGRKHRDLMASVGLAARALDLDDLADGTVLGMVDPILTEAAPRARLRAVRDRYRAALEPELSALVDRVSRRRAGRVPAEVVS